jgi:hypothetical protein
MRITVRQAADAHGAPGPVSDYVGQVIPLQLTDELAFPARLESVARVDFGGSDQVPLTFRWNRRALGAARSWFTVSSVPMAGAR